MADKETKKTPFLSWAVLGLMVVLIGVAAYFVKGVLSDESPNKKSAVMISLLKPPPPPPPKEKPPEPELVKQIPKKEEIVDVPQKVVNQESKPAGEPDKAPAGNDLGVDAEGTAGGDAFGLVGKKGGRSIIAGEGGSGGNGSGLGKLNLLSKYSGYTGIAESEIKEAVFKRLDEEAGIPRGRLQAVARIRVDSSGLIIECRLIGSSGNHRMDDTIKRVLRDMKISEPPPHGMPQKMDIKFIYQS
jgi:periplasmic protein TonB